MNKVTVISSYELSEVQKAKIADIMATSQCPNESLMNSFEDCYGLNNGQIIIGSESAYTYEIQY